MINRQMLVDSGYIDQGPYYGRKLFQKKFSNHRGVKYFIDIYEYNWELIGVSNREPPFSYQPEITFYDFNCSQLFTMTVTNQDVTKDIDSLEAFVDNVWHTLNLGYYST